MSEAAKTRRPERIALRAILIYEASIAEAKGSFPDYLEYPSDGEMSIPNGTRGQAAAFFAAEFGCDFTQVRVTRKWCRVNFDAIRDLASDLACDDAYEDDEIPVAYTWEGDGWSWVDCKAKDPGAVAFWHCEEKAVPNAQ